MSDNTTPGVNVMTDFVMADSSVYSGYVDYIDRENAVRNEYVTSYSIYADYMDNPEKTTDLFTNNSERLTSDEKLNLKRQFERAQHNGSPMWQTVISFDNQWLEKYGIYNSETKFLDERRIKQYTRNAVNKLLKAEGLDLALWSGAIHFNTDNIHVHIATIEPIPTRKKEIKTELKLSASWVRNNNILFGDYRTDKYISTYKGNISNDEKEIYNRLRLATKSDFEFCRGFTVNKDGSITVITKKQYDRFPKYASVVRSTEQYRGKFELKSILDCRQKIADQIMYQSKGEWELLNAMRKSITVSMRGNILLEDREIVEQFLKVYKSLPDNKNLWKYKDNRIAHARSELDKITTYWINKHKAQEFNTFKEEISKKMEQQNEAFRGKNNPYMKNQIRDLYKRCGNAILDTMKNLSFKDIHELESSSYIAAEVDEAAATGSEIDFDGRIDYGYYSAETDESNSENGYQGDGRYWSDAFKNAKRRLKEILDIKDEVLKEAKASEIERVISVFEREADAGNDVAAYELGRCYEIGTFGKVDSELSQQYYELAFKGFNEKLNSDLWLDNKIKEHEFLMYNTNLSADKTRKMADKFVYEENRLNFLYDYLYYRVGKMYVDGRGTEKNIQKGIENLQESESPYASYTLGNIYYRGEDAEKDFTRAFEYFSNAAFPDEDDKFVPFAAYNMAEMIEKNEITGSGFAVQDLYSKALSGFLSAESKDENDLIEYKIGTMYLSGKGCEINNAKAEEYLMKSALYGNIYAKIKLADIYESEHFGRAIILLQSACKDNNDIAQYKLGKIYIDKSTEYFNLQEGLDLLQKSAAQDNQFAQHQLGKIYLEGELFEQNIPLAIQYFEKSAEQDNQFAQYQLGKVYLSNDYGYKNIYQSLLYFNASAEQNNQFAQYQLGLLYYKGDEIERDTVLAIDYFEKSAEQGNQFAQYQLGVIYLKGEVVQTDIPRAIKYLEQSAEQNNQFAQYQLGKIYYFGADGVDPDREKAEDYLRRSAAQGNEFAKALLEWQPSSGGYMYRGRGFNEDMLSLASNMRQLFERLANEHDHMLNQMIFERIEREKQKDNKELQ